MCVAAIPAWLTTALSVAGTVFGGISQANAAKAGADAQASYYDYSAKIAKQNADLEADKQRQFTERASYAQKQNAMEYRQRLAANRNALANAGVSGGTSESLLADVFRAEDYDSKVIAYNAMMQVFGSSVDQANFINQKNQNEVASRNTRAAGEYSASNIMKSTVLSAATQVAGSWGKMFGSSNTPAKPNFPTQTSSWSRKG